MSTLWALCTQSLWLAFVLHLFRTPGCLPKILFRRILSRRSDIKRCFLRVSLFLFERTKIFVLVDGFFLALANAYLSHTSFVALASIYKLHKWRMCHIKVLFELFWCCVYNCNPLVYKKPSTRPFVHYFFARHIFCPHLCYETQRSFWFHCSIDSFVWDLVYFEHD